MVQAMTTAEVMQALRIKKVDTLHKLVKQKKLPAGRVGREYRFDPDVVRAFLRDEISKSDPSPRKSRKKEVPDAFSELMRGVPRKY